MVEDIKVEEESTLNIYYNRLEIYKILLSLYELRLASLLYDRKIATNVEVEEKKVKAKNGLLTLIYSLADTYEEDEGLKSLIKFNKWEDLELVACFESIIRELYYHYEDRFDPVIDDGEFDILERFFKPKTLYKKNPNHMDPDHLTSRPIPVLLKLIEYEEERCKNLVKSSSKNKGVNHE